MFSSVCSPQTRDCHKEKIPVRVVDEGIASGDGGQWSVLPPCESSFLVAFVPQSFGLLTTTVAPQNLARRLKINIRALKDSLDVGVLYKDHAK